MPKHVHPQPVTSSEGYLTQVNRPRSSLVHPSEGLAMEHIEGNSDGSVLDFDTVHEVLSFTGLEQSHSNTLLNYQMSIVVTILGAWYQYS